MAAAKKALAAVKDSDIDGSWSLLEAGKTIITMPRRAVLTNMHNDLDYATLAAELPAGVAPAYDGMTIEIGP